MGRRLIMTGLVFWVGLLQAQDKDGLLLEASLRSAVAERGRAEIFSRDGRFDADGWRSVSSAGQLKVVLPDRGVMSGQLCVDVTGIEWPKAGSAGGGKKKIHFLNFSSNASGDHHAEDGGTENDALWTLRVGTDSVGNPRYGNDIKVLWSARGAKRANGSQYKEARARAPENWRWNADRRYTFCVTWDTDKLRVAVNGHLFFEGAWVNQKEPLKHIFIGRGGDFGSWIGPRFSNLRVFAYPTDTHAIQAIEK